MKRRRGRPAEVREPAYSRGFQLMLVAVIFLSLAGIVLILATGQGPRLAGHATGEPAPIISSEPFAGPQPIGTAPALPTGLRVAAPALKIDLPVVQGDGVSVPLNRAALFPGLGTPGSGRRTVLYAHAQPGMFGSLVQAKIGQTVTVTSATGHALSYAVTEVHTDWPVSDRRWLEQADGEQLVLIACTTYDPFDPRVIVVASPA